MPRPRSYEEIVERHRWGPRLKAMEEPEYFAKLSSLEEAIDAVADARKENGALFNHQRHLGSSTVEEVRRVLWANRETIGHVSDFDELIALVERLIGTISGVKEMYIYDAALRLGAILKMMPTRVYLHRGTRPGAEALGIVVAERKAIEVSELPPAFKVLTADESEDVLCRYKDDLAWVRRRFGDAVVTAVALAHALRGAGHSTRRSDRVMSLAVTQPRRPGGTGWRGSRAVESAWRSGPATGRA